MTDKKSTVDNSKNNRILGIAVIAFYIIGLAAAAFTGYWPATWLVVAAGVSTAFFGYKNLTADETTDNWIGSVGWVSVLLTIILFVIPIARHSV